MRILILKSYGIGNAYMATPLIRALYEKGHEIYLLGDSGPLGGPYKDMFDGWDMLAGLETFNRGKEKNGNRILRWVGKIKPDLCIQSWPSDSIWDWLFQYLDCKIIKAPRVDEFTKHETEYNLDMVRDLIGDYDDINYEIPMQPVDEDRLDKLIGNYDKKKIVALCPCYKKEGKWYKKHWGTNNYAHLAALLVASGYKVVLLDGADGISICNLISHAVPEVANLAGLTTVQETIAVLDRSYAVIANDSGPAHIASGLGKPLIVFFGPTSAIKNRPIGPHTLILSVGSDKVEEKTSNTLGEESMLKMLQPGLIMNTFEKYIVKEEKEEKVEECVGVD